MIIIGTTSKASGDIKFFFSLFASFLNTSFFMEINLFWMKLSYSGGERQKRMNWKQHVHLWTLINNFFVGSQLQIITLILDHHECCS